MAAGRNGGNLANGGNYLVYNITVTSSKLLEVIQCISNFPKFQQQCISEAARRRAKRRKTWDSGSILNWYIQGTLPLALCVVFYTCRPDRAGWFDPRPRQTKDVKI